MNKPYFVNQVTHVPSEWANAVSDLVYDVFKEAKTTEEAKRLLGIGKMAAQDPANIVISGGTMDGVTIGSALPANAVFTEAKATRLDPTTDQSLVTKNWVERQIRSALGKVGFGSMGQQNSDSVYITGGTIAIDRITVRKTPILSTDVVTLGFLNDQIKALKDWIPKQVLPTNPGTPTTPTTDPEYKCKLFQAPMPLVPCPTRRVYCTPFKFKCGNILTFVDGVYQLPDVYAATNNNTIVFFEPLPEGAVVGAVSIGAVDKDGNPIDCGCDKTLVGCEIIQGAQPFDKCKNGLMIFLPFKIRTGLVLFVDGVYQLPDMYEITSPESVRMRNAVPEDSIISGFTV